MKIFQSDNQTQSKNISLQKIVIYRMYLIIYNQINIILIQNDKKLREKTVRNLFMNAK